MSILRINGSEIADPSEFQWDEQELDSEASGRTADGTMVRDRIGVKVKLNVKWNALNSEQISKILNAVRNPFFEINYPDALKGSNVTKTFYVGSKSAPLYSIQNNNAVWQGLSMNFIEK